MELVIIDTSLPHHEKVKSIPLRYRYHAGNGLHIQLAHIVPDWLPGFIPCTIDKSMLSKHDLIYEYQVKVILGYIVDTIPKLLELYLLFFYLLGLSDLRRRHLVEMYLTLSIQTP